MTAIDYGLADHGAERALSGANTLVLDLELRPQDQALGRVWMRDTYVNYFVVDGVGRYYCTGTTRAAGLAKGAPWNDGLWLWSAPRLQGPWTLVDTTAIRPGGLKGQVWASNMAAENRAGHVVVAPYQAFADADDPAKKRGQVWAPELHFIRGRWLLVACMGDDAIVPGSFILVSEGGPEGPYRNIAANIDKPLGDELPGKPGCYPIDGSLFDDGDAGVHLVLHNHFHARLSDDLEHIVPAAGLPRFQEQAYAPEPYLEGAYVQRWGGRYHLLQAAWAYRRPDGAMHYVPRPGDEKLHYDTVVASSERFEGPYGPRRTMGIGIGHNNSFLDEEGRPWATFFKNPAFGHYAAPSRRDEAAVAGVVRLDANPGGDLLVAP